AKTVVREPGLHVKLPFIQNVERYERRILSLDPPAEEVLLSDQKRLIVNAFARYRISDPLRFFQSVRDETRFTLSFGNIMNSAVRAIVARHTQAQLLSDQRSQIIQDIFDIVSGNAGSFGVELVDIRIGRTELPEAVSQNVYNRMQTEREREANLLRAEGEEESRRIRAAADRQQVIIIAEAQRESNILRGQGDAARNRILAKAFNKDPEFFDFYRSLEAYRDAFGQNGGSTMVLSPDSDFFRYFGNAAGSSAIED
ncbi:MAG: protease modulator HflC, partial [Alphaproteobacteria bacterium]